MQWIKCVTDSKGRCHYHINGHGRCLCLARYKQKCLSSPRSQVYILNHRMNHRSERACSHFFLFVNRNARAVFAPHKGFNSHRDTRTGAGLKMFGDNFASGCTGALYDFKEQNGYRDATIRSDAFPGFWTGIYIYIYGGGSPHTHTLTLTRTHSFLKSGLPSEPRRGQAPCQQYSGGESM